LSFQTANGLIQAPVTNLDSITVGGIKIRNLPTAVHDAIPDPQVAGLLGQFLSNFKMDIDTQKGVLHLEKKKERVSNCRSREATYCVAVYTSMQLFCRLNAAKH
jgi:hypothetical protein